MRITISLIFLINIAFIISPKKFFVQYNYNEIMEIFKNLSQSCSQYIKIDTAQNRYGLNSTKGCGKNNDECLNLIVFMTDFDSYTLDRPVYYISGLLHGDEVIGASSVTEFAKYFCNNYENNRNSIYHHILKHKLIILTPMTNSFGYYNNKREDKVYVTHLQKWETSDPNRDFPYWKSSNNLLTKCMRTITGRTINEIFNEFIIEGSITFHGGTTVLGYAWGNYYHIEKKNGKTVSTEAPDYQAFSRIGKVMQSLSSSEDNKKNNIKNFILGDMTSTVYPIDGGLEDWSYGGSWENQINQNLGIDKIPIKTCKSDTFNGYKLNWDLNNTDYKLRCLMYLAEASEKKNPTQKEFGLNNFNTKDNRDIFDFHKTKNFLGLIPRNMRLMYSGIDLISSSIYFDSQRILEKDNKIIIPFLFMGCLSLKKYSIYKISFNYLTKDILEINNLKANSEEKNIYLEISSEINCYYKNLTYYNIEIEKLGYGKKNIRNLQSYPKETNNNSDNFFRTGGNYDFFKELSKNINIELKNGYLPFKGNLYYIRGEAPDQEWENQINPDPKVTPQSHIVRSKINSSYHVFNGNYSLNSNYYFYSYPIISLENGEIQIINDIDSLFYEDNFDLFELIVNENRYKINPQIVFHKVIQRQNYLSSENKYIINFEMHISDEKNNLQKMLNESQNTELIAQIALNDESEIYKLDKLSCNFSGKETLFIRCENILKESTYEREGLTGINIRKKLPNSILGFHLKSNNGTLFNTFMQISLKNTEKGKYFFNSKDGSKIICSSDFFYFLNFWNKTNIDKNTHKIYYEIIIKKKSTTNLSLEIKIENNNFNNNKYYLLLFPFVNKIEIISIDKPFSIEVTLNEKANGNIIGKAGYLISIKNEYYNKVKEIINSGNLEFQYNNVDNIIFRIKNETGESISNYLPCSIMSLESVNNEASMNELKKMVSELGGPSWKTEEFIASKKDYFLVFIVCSIVSIVLIIIIFLLFRKKKNDISSYNNFKDIEIKENSANL